MVGPNNENTEYKIVLSLQKYGPVHNLCPAL